MLSFMYITIYPHLKAGHMDIQAVKNYGNTLTSYCTDPFHCQLNAIIMSESVKFPCTPVKMKVWDRERLLFSTNSHLCGGDNGQIDQSILQKQLNTHKLSAWSIKRLGLRERLYLELLLWVCDNHLNTI